MVEYIEQHGLLDKITFDSLFSGFCKVSGIQQSIMDAFESNSRESPPGIDPYIGLIFINLVGIPLMKKVLGYN